MGRKQKKTKTDRRPKKERTVAPVVAQASPAMEAIEQPENRVTHPWAVILNEEIVLETEDEQMARGRFEWLEDTAAGNAFLIQNGRIMQSCTFF